MILLDGSFGTCLWGKAEKKGIEKITPWMFNLKNPEMVKELNMEYFEAGTRIIQTNSFSVNPDSIKNSGYELKEIIKAAVNIAKDARNDFDPSGKENIKVSLDIGPLARYLDPIGDLTEDEAKEEFTAVIDAGIEAGVDQIFLETFTDLNMMNIAARIAMETGKHTFVSFAFDERCRTLCGDYPKDIAIAMAEIGVDAIGANCGAGLASAFEVLKQYKEALDKFSEDSGIKREVLPKLLIKPNVEEGVTPIQFAEKTKDAMQLAEYIGACCGSNPDYIAALNGLNV